MPDFAAPLSPAATPSPDPEGSIGRRESLQADARFRQILEQVPEPAENREQALLLLEAIRLIPALSEPQAAYSRGVSIYERQLLRGAHFYATRLKLISSEEESAALEVLVAAPEGALSALERGLVTGQLGVNCGYAGQIERAEQYLGEALTLLQSGQHFEHSAHLLRQHALLLDRVGRGSEAISYAAVAVVDADRAIENPEHPWSGVVWLRSNGCRGTLAALRYKALDPAATDYVVQLRPLVDTFEQISQKSGQTPALWALPAYQANDARLSLAERLPAGEEKTSLLTLALTSGQASLVEDRRLKLGFFNEGLDQLTLARVNLLLGNRDQAREALALARDALQQSGRSDYNEAWARIERRLAS
jgi:hypothetical protein